MHLTILIVVRDILHPAKNCLTRHINLLFRYIKLKTFITLFDLGSKVPLLYAQAIRIFEKKGIKVSTILKERHPSETIAKVSEEGEFDMVVIGSRGLGGLKKALLGSVSNAIVQEVKTKVLVVK